MSGGIGLTNPDTDDAKAMLEAFSWKGWNFNPLLVNTTQAYTSQTTRFTQVYLRAGDIVTNLHMMVTVTAGTVTTIKYGIYDLSGNRLARTANSAAAHNATGYTTIALTSPYTVPTTGAYFFASLVDAGTAGSSGVIGAITGKTTPGGTYAAFGGTEASQTDLDATATISITGIGQFWAWD